MGGRGRLVGSEGVALLHPLDRWPTSDAELVELQHRLASLADHQLAADPWSAPERVAIGACVVAFARGEAGPGRPGDRAWAAAAVWCPEASTGQGPGRDDRHVRPAAGGRAPRPADEVLSRAVVADRVPAAYAPGLLARREGPVLAAAVAALALRPDVLLVDATGRDHPRRAGLATHLGAVSGIPTVGVTHRPLLASGPPPPFVRGARAPLHLDGDPVGYWVCTRSGAKPVVAHAAWRTSPETAAEVVLAGSSQAARTPIPLREARRVAREARARGGDA